MKLEINIEQIVSDAVAAALAPEVIQPIITANVQKAVKTAIEEQFNYRSPFTKLLESSLEAVMPTSIDGLNRYGDLVSKTVVEIVDKYQQQHISQAVAEKLEGMLKPLPASMKLSELVRKLMPSLSERFERDGSSRPTIIVEHSEQSVVKDYWDLFIDPKAHVDKYRCSIHARFRGEGASECWAMEIRGHEVGKSLLLGPAFGVDNILTNLYLGGVKIILDQEDFDEVFYGEDDEYNDGEDD